MIRVSQCVPVVSGAVSVCAWVCCVLSAGTGCSGRAEPPAALHTRYNRELSTLLQSSKKKLWQTWSGLSFSLSGSRGLCIQTLWLYPALSLFVPVLFFKKSQILFLGKPTVSYRRYWDIKPKALHNVQIYLSNKGGVVGKEKENTSIWQLTSYSQMWRW